MSSLKDEVSSIIKSYCKFVIFFQNLQQDIDSDFLKNLIPGDELELKTFGDCVVVGKSAKTISQNSCYILRCPKGHVFLEKKGNLTKKSYPRRKCPICEGKINNSRMLQKAQSNNIYTGILGVTPCRHGMYRARIDILGYRIESLYRDIEHAKICRSIFESIKSNFPYWVLDTELINKEDFNV